MICHVGLDTVHILYVPMNDYLLRSNTGDHIPLFIMMMQSEYLNGVGSWVTMMIDTFFSLYEILEILHTSKI